MIVVIQSEKMGVKIDSTLVLQMLIDYCNTDLFIVVRTFSFAKFVVRENFVTHEIPEPRNFLYSENIGSYSILYYDECWTILTLLQLNLNLY